MRSLQKIISIKWIAIVAFALIGIGFAYSKLKPDPILKRAESGDLDAIYTMGLQHYEGLNRRKDPQAAYRWFLAAAERDHVPAQAIIGSMHYQGEGVAKDLEQSFKWFSRAATKGHVQALYALGLLYTKGEGVPKDMVKGITLLEAAAQAKSEVAQLELVKLLAENKMSNPVDPTHDINYWYDQLAALGNSEAMIYKGVQLWESGDVSQSCEWYKKAYTKNHAAAGYALANCVRQKIVTESPEMAMTYLQHSAEHGFIPAILEIAAAYASGDGIAKDKNKAIALYQKAANSGDTYGIYNLAFAYRYDHERPADARQLFERIADGYPPAQYELAIMYGLGLGGAKDEKRAAQLYLAAAEKNYIPAQYNLGVLYMKGEGLSQDTKTAELWLKKAADQGHTKAKTLLQELAHQATSNGTNAKSPSPEHQGHDHRHTH